MTKVEDTATAAAAALVKSTADQTATSLNIQYIQRDIAEIKASVRGFEGQFVSRTEFSALTKSVEVSLDHMDGLEGVVQKGLGAVGVLAFIVPLIIKFFVK